MVNVHLILKTPTTMTGMPAVDGSAKSFRFATKMFTSVAVGNAWWVSLETSLGFTDLAFLVPAQLSWSLYTHAGNNHSLNTHMLGVLPRHS